MTAPPTVASSEADAPAFSSSSSLTADAAEDVQIEYEGIDGRSSHDEEDHEPAPPVVDPDPTAAPTTTTTPLDDSRHRLNALVWPNVPDLDHTKLPLPLEIIPEHVTSLKECAAWQIQSLLGREGPNLSPDEEDAIDDGFVLCDVNVVKNKYLAWRQMFPILRPFFALKCNPDPMVAGVLGQLGSGFDCASVPEILLALGSTTGDVTSAIYANPQRAEKDLETALRRNVKTLTFDGVEELHKVHRIYQKLLDQHQHQQPTLTTPPPSPPDMVLRILVPDKHSTVPLGEKFGVPPEQVEALAEMAVDLHLTIVGVSFHCGSGNHDPDAYRVAVQLAYEASRNIENVYNNARTDGASEHRQHRCWLLDIGGGFPGRDGCGADLGRFVGVDKSTKVSPEALLAEQEGESALRVAETVVPLLKTLYPNHEESVALAASDPTLPPPDQFMAEPGRYFVEAAFALCSRIYRVQVEDNVNPHRHYYIGQGVQGLFKDCILCGESFLPVPYALQPDREDQEPVPCTIHGPSGEEYDVVCRDYLLPPLEVGDWLIFDRMGAYTLSIAARSGRPAVRYVMGASQLPAPSPAAPSSLE